MCLDRRMHVINELVQLLVTLPYIACSQQRRRKAAQPPTASCWTF